MLDRTAMESVGAAVEGLRNEMIRNLQELVAIPSVVGQELAAQEYMEGLYKTLALQTKRVQADPAKLREHPAFIHTGSHYQGRPNILGILSGMEDCRSLVVNGHVDVVSPEPLHAWTRDPWGGRVEGDRLYGRGAGDMKAGLLANFFALRAIREAGLQPDGTVILQSVVDEEAGGAGGTLACLAAGPAADAFLCTEPHGINVTVAHAGVSHFRVRVVGRTAHGGLAHEGVNAIGRLIPIYQALERLDVQRGREVHYPLFHKGSGRSCHLSAGIIRGGDWPSTVAGQAEIECRISFIPGETLSAIRNVVEDTVREVAAKDDWLRDHPPFVEWFGWQTEPWEQDPTHPFVQCLKCAAETVVKRPVDFIGRASGLDARFAGYFGMPSSCIGPRAGNIHGIDEYVEISSMIEVTKIVALTILDWCGQRG